MSKALTVVYFSSGKDRWSDKIPGLKTTWDGNTMVGVEEVDLGQLSAEVQHAAVPIMRKVYDAMLNGTGDYDKPWNHAKPVKEPNHGE